MAERFNPKVFLCQLLSNAYIYKQLTKTFAYKCRQLIKTFLSQIFALRNVRKFAHSRNPQKLLDTKLFCNMQYFIIIYDLQNQRYISILLPVARWLLCLLCTHKCAKPLPQVRGMLYLGGS